MKSPFGWDNKRVESYEIGGLAMEGLDPYGVLGVSRDADDCEIRAAFQRMALLWHPDRCQEAEV